VKKKSTAAHIWEKVRSLGAQMMCKSKENKYHRERMSTGLRFKGIKGGKNGLQIPRGELCLEKRKGRKKTFNAEDSPSWRPLKIPMRGK